MNRLGLFLCFDSEGTIDEYVKYLLEDMKKNLSHLCIIVNGELSYESRTILMQYSTDIITRQNIGFDVGGWRDAMTDHFGFEKLQEYDEIILFNDSFFGPIYPFKEMFDVMDSKDIDFWGITVHGETHNAKNLCPYGYRPRYLQTYFMAFRQNLVKSKEFQEYWSNLPNFTEFNAVAFKHQAVFTRYFSDLGYKWEAYVDTSDLEETIDNPVSFHTFKMFDLVVNRRMPVIKRKAFKLPRQRHLRYNIGKDISSTMDYLDKYTNYDVSLIYKYFLRILDHDSLANTLNSVRIFPKENTITKQSNKKIAVIAHLNNSHLWEYAYNYIKNIPEYIDIIITTDTKEKKEIFEKNILEKLNNKSQVILVNTKYHEINASFICCKDILKNYEYFCYINDKKWEGTDYITVYESIKHILWENTLASTNYIESIIEEFDNKSNLGLIVPPKINHGTYFFSYAKNYWNESFEQTQKLLEQMNINLEISKEYPPISIGNCFWAKYDALKPLFELDIDSENYQEEQILNDEKISSALERSYGYVAASQSYYSEIVMTEDYGRVELSNYEHMFSRVLTACQKNKNNALVLDKTFEHFVNSVPKALKTVNPKKVKKIQKQNQKLKKSLKNYQEKTQLGKNLKNKLDKYNTARIDIKNFGSAENNIELLKISDHEANYLKPRWFKTHEGIGLTIESKKNYLELKVKCICDGNLRIDLKGIDFRLRNGRFPININFTKFKLNDEVIFNESKIVHHDAPYIFEKKVYNEDIVKLYFEWMPV